MIMKKPLMVSFYVYSIYIIIVIVVKHALAIICVCTSGENFHYCRSHSWGVFMPASNSREFNIVDTVTAQ